MTIRPQCDNAIHKVAIILYQVPGEQRPTEDYKGLQGLTEDYKGLLARPVAGHDGKKSC